MNEHNISKPSAEDYACLALTPEELDLIMIKPVISVNTAQSTTEEIKP